jgi:hypothetical protein
MIGNLLMAGALALGPTQEITSIEQAIQICRTTLFIDRAKGMEMYEAVPEDQKPSIAAICAAYRQGALDLAKLMESKKAE